VLCHFTIHCSILSFSSVKSFRNFCCHCYRFIITMKIKILFCTQIIKLDYYTDIVFSKEIRSKLVRSYLSCIMPNKLYFATRRKQWISSKIYRYDNIVFCIAFIEKHSPNSNTLRYLMIFDVKQAKSIISMKIWNYNQMIYLFM